MTVARTILARGRGALVWSGALVAAAAWLMPSATPLGVTVAGFLVGAWVALADAPRGRRAIRAATGGVVIAGLVVLARLAAEALTPSLGRAAWLAPLVIGILLLLTDVPALGRLARLTAVELRKVGRGRLMRTGLLATAALTALATVTYDAVPGATGWTRAAQGLGAGQWVSEVFLLVLGATAVAGEATGGTLKMMLPHAYRRGDWILAKAAILVIAAVAFGLVVAAASLLPAALQDGLGNVETEPLFGEPADSAEVFATAATMRDHYLATVAAGVAAAAGMAIVGLFLSTLFDGVVAALSTAFLVFAGVRLADVVLAVPREDLVHRLFAWPPVAMRETLGKLGRGLSERWDPTLLAGTLALTLVSSVLLLLLATRLFRVRDVHA